MAVVAPSTRRWLWYEFCRIWFRLPAALIFHLRYTGQENVPREGPVVVVANHQSHLDPPLVGGGIRRQMNYVARDTLFGFPPLDWLMYSLNAIPIDREGGGLAGLKETLRRLKRGEMVLLFPEGTRTRDGRIGPFRPGFTALAFRGRAWVLPVAIEGAFCAWPRRRRFPWVATIHVHYGPPLSPEEVSGYSEEGLLAEVEHRVRVCHAMLCRRPVLARQRSRQPCSAARL